MFFHGHNRVSHASLKRFMHNTSCLVSSAFIKPVQIVGTRGRHGETQGERGRDEGLNEGGEEEVGKETKD